MRVKGIVWCALVPGTLSFFFPSEISIDFEQYIDKPEELAVVNVPKYGSHRGSGRPTGNRVVGH